MKITIDSVGAFGSALVALEGDERFVSESGALYRSSVNVDVDVTTRTRGRGGLLGGLGRLLAGNSFFLSTYTLTDGGAGEVALAPTLEGEVRRIDLNGDRWTCAGASFLGAGSEVGLETRFQGLRGMVSGEGLFLVEAHGTGPLLVSAFGSIHELEVEDELVVDTGHLVAFEEGLDYTIDRAGGSWIQSFLGGEGFVLRLRGRGRVLLQSHDPGRFGALIGKLLPPRRQ
ncbi:TIGR00266 family protein [Engelhardtia mirabilis]|uniref:TIGR00266 family protein n=1 Tax=Engelhardtia mirabilis TaxID=2528011 RepID=A0A518BHI2_9BACT|nr:hypothetical protein Pla133_14860 [Planctomycetes bacterium Pla133]QDV00740.1 hypothetical protein Pla86_14850 [Planctomycetes bacterium Pla86]